MPRFSPEDLATWARGTWSSLPEEPLHSVGHDTRTLEPGALYVAMAGARVDGHDLIPEAMAKGALGVLCAKGRAHPDIPCLEVEDPAMALRGLATGYRKTLNGIMVGITGSAGKTTAKDFLAAMCRAAGPTCATPGNWNNFIGLPLSILRMESDDAFGVFELGMNHAGEIAALAEILLPDLACITSIGEAHLEQLGSLRAIAEEKSSLFTMLPANGVAVLDLDSEWRDLVESRIGSRKISCSMFEEADVMGRPADHPGVLRVEDRTRGELFELPLPLPGSHMRKNLLQTVILAREMGITAEQMTAGLEAYAGSPMRWEVHSIGGRVFINDAYNANPLSMRCALNALMEDAGETPCWAVLGAMAELGPEERMFHRALGKELDTLGLQGVIVVGEAGRWIAEGMKEVHGFHAHAVEQAAELVIDEIPRQTQVLIKASRSVGLERLVALMQEKHTL